MCSGGWFELARKEKEKRIQHSSGTSTCVHIYIILRILTGSDSYSRMDGWNSFPWGFYYYGRFVLDGHLIRIRTIGVWTIFTYFTYLPCCCLLIT